MQTQGQRWEPLVGVVFAGLFVAGGLLTTMAYGASGSEIATAFQTAGTRIRYGGALVLISAAPLLLFAACLRRRLTADGDDGHLAAIVGIAGGASAAVVLSSAAALLGAVSRSGMAESIQPTGAAAAWDLYGALLGLALPVPLAVLIAAVTTAARRSGWFAGWAAWLSWPLVAGLLVLPVAWMFLAAAVLWVAGVSVWMVARRPQAHEPATGARTA